jgi:hypothetical protein
MEPVFSAFLRDPTGIGQVVGIEQRLIVQPEQSPQASLPLPRWSQSLEVTHGELITGEALLLTRREEL